MNTDTTKNHVITKVMEVPYRKTIKTMLYESQSLQRNFVITKKKFGPVVT